MLGIVILSTEMYLDMSYCRTFESIFGMRLFANWVLMKSFERSAYACIYMHAMQLRSQAGTLATESASQLQLHYFPPTESCRDGCGTDPQQHTHWPNHGGILPWWTSTPVPQGGRSRIWEIPSTPRALPGIASYHLRSDDFPRTAQHSSIAMCRQD